MTRPEHRRVECDSNSEYGHTSTASTSNMSPPGDASRAYSTSPEVSGPRQIDQDFRGVAAHPCWPALRRGGAPRVSTGAAGRLTSTNAQTAPAHVDRLPPDAGAGCGDLERARVVSRLAAALPRAHRTDPARLRRPGRRQPRRAPGLGSGPQPPGCRAAPG